MPLEAVVLSISWETEMGRVWSCHSITKFRLTLTWAFWVPTGDYQPATYHGPGLINSDTVCTIKSELIQVRVFPGRISHGREPCGVHCRSGTSQF